MKSFSAFILLLIIGISIGKANAQSDRTYVSTTGADTQSCGTPVAPCRDFGVAIGKTNNGGEVIALDSGLYDPFLNVTRPITLSAAPGVHAELANNGSQNYLINISAGSTGTVVLRNLYFGKIPSASPLAGIKLTSVSVLMVENCVFDGFGYGMDLEATASTQVSVKNSTFRNGNAGVVAQTTSGVIKVSLDACHFENFTGSASSSYLGHGVMAMQNARIMIKNSVATACDGAGFFVGASGGELEADSCESFGNRDGFLAYGVEYGNGLVIVTNSSATNNTRYGFGQIGGATFYSFGNNMVRRNSTNTFGTMTALSGT